MTDTIVGTPEVQEAMMATAQRTASRLPLIDRFLARQNHLPKATPWQMQTVRIPMRDGIEVGADVYTPAGVSKGLVLTWGPYGRGGLIAASSARLYAAQGYTLVSASTRGAADSG